MLTTIQDIRQGIRELGLGGLPLCVHSSLRSFGRVEGGPQAVIDGLRQEGCTVMVPAFSGGYRVPCPPHLQPPRNGRDYAAGVTPTAGLERIYTPESNEVDTYRMGVVPEALLRYPERRRGNHAICSFAAVGPLADALVRDQAPLDVFAPYKALARLGGWVVLMGVWLDRLTLLHLAEQLAGRNLFRFCANDRHGQPAPLEGGGCSAGFVKLASLLEPLLRQTTVGASLWRALPARETLEIATAAIRRDPQITHCGNPACRSCNDAVAGGPIL